MKLLTLFFFIFSILTKSLFGQLVGNGYTTIDFTPDSSLKEIHEWNIDRDDSTLISKGFYSNGFLKNKIHFLNNHLVSEYCYQYDENGLYDYVSKTSKDINGKDTSKTITYLLRDQYGNTYFERVSDSLTTNTSHNSYSNYEVQNTYFTSYIYEDSLVLYSNFVNDLGGGIQHWSNKYEYDSKKRLIKTYKHNMSDSTNYYRLVSEFFYDELDNKIKIVSKCINYYKNLKGKKIYRECDDDLTLYTYNNLNQLSKIITKSNSIFQYEAETLYYYDTKGRILLISFFEKYSNRTLYYQFHY